MVEVDAGEDQKDRHHKTQRSQLMSMAVVTETKLASYPGPTARAVGPGYEAKTKPTTAVLLKIH